MIYTNIIFDLDDTLCDCNIYYVDGREKLITMLHTKTGIPVFSIRNIFKSIDTEARKASGGFARTRLPKTYSATAAACSILSQQDENLTNDAMQIAEEVFNAPYKLFFGSGGVLRACKDMGLNMFLYTLGDPEIQYRKITDNNLLRFFDKENITIVDAKTTANLTDFIKKHELNIDSTLLVGDSLRHDIIPANNIQMDTVWIRHKFLDLNEDVTATYTIDNIVELLGLLEQTKEMEETHAKME